MKDYAGNYMANGRDVAAARVRGVDDNMVRPHRHDYFEIYALEAGCRYHWADHSLYLMEPPELIIFPPGVEHFSYGDEGVTFRRVVIYFRETAVLYPHVLDQIRDDVMVFRPARDGHAGVRGIIEQILAVQEQNGASSRDEARLLATQLLVKMLGAEKRDARTRQREGRTAELIHHLHDNFTEPIDLGTLAEHFFVSPYYLCREFKKHTGSTIINYVNGLRIGQAVRLLQETDETVASISSQVGFANVTHFNRVFRARMGVSPSSLRTGSRRAEAI